MFDTVVVTTNAPEEKGDAYMIDAPAGTGNQRTPRTLSGSPLGI